MMHSAIDMCNEIAGNVLCVLPDGGEKYLDSIYSDKWLMEKGVVVEQQNINDVHILNIDGLTDYSEFIRKLRGVVLKDEDQGTL